jgi:signal transduction histidine kinase
MKIKIMGKSFFNSIRVRIIITVIILITVPFAILQLSNNLLIYNKLQKKTIYTTEALSVSIATNVSEYIRGAYNQSLLLSQDSNIISGTEKGKKIVEKAITQFPYFRLLYIQDMTGNQMIRSSGELANRSDRWWFHQMVEKPEGFVSEAYISVNNNQLITSIFLPMYKGDEMTGIYGADLSLASIKDTIGQYWNKDISYIVLDSKGTVLTSSDIKEGEYINFIECTKRTVMLDDKGKYILDNQGQIMTNVEKIKLSKSLKKIISNALDLKTQSFQFKEKNDIVVCAYQPIELPGSSQEWSVIVFQKQTDYMSILVLIIAFVVLILISTLITFRQINKQVLTPVIQIQQDLNLITEGNLNIKIDVPNQNEIGELASAINMMVESLKLHQQRLDQDEKMAALGNLVAGVAHEINTPLGIGVTTSTYMQKINAECRRALVEGKFTKQELLDYMSNMNESLELLQFNLERGSKIIQSFKKIAVDQTTESQEEFDLQQYIEGIVTSLIHEYKNSGHHIEIECEEELIIKSYPGVFAQILTNFIMNSLEHAFKNKENGKINISARRQDKFLILKYEDDGCGINEEQKAHLFTPFFTTNKEMGGSGLGLSIVYNLVTQKLNGKIEVFSVENNGISFTITIPLQEEDCYE